MGYETLAERLVEQIINQALEAAGTPPHHEPPNHEPEPQQ